MIKKIAKDEIREKVDDIKESVRTGKKKIEKKLDIKEEMTAGQKAGKVAEKFVDLLEKGIHKLDGTVEGWQQKRYAPIKDLKMEGSAKIIGEERDSPITLVRAEMCRAFAEELRKTEMPDDLKNPIIEDAISYACVSYGELREVYLSTTVPKTQAEIEFLKKKLNEAEKYVKSE